MKALLTATLVAFVMFVGSAREAEACHGCGLRAAARVGRVVTLPARVLFRGRRACARVRRAACAHIVVSHPAQKASPVQKSHPAQKGAGVVEGEHYVLRRGLLGRWRLVPVVVN